MVAYALLAASMLWGLWLSTRAPAPPGRPWVLEVHRALSGVAVLALAGHLLSILADSYVTFDVVDVLVPFASSWNPAAVAWGVLAAWLVVAVEVTSLLRRTLTKRTWRKVHLASFGGYLLATGHFLTAGTDAGNRLVLALVLGTFAAVATGTAFRITQHVKEAAWSPPADRPSVSLAGPPPSVPVPPSPPAP
jgi:predicted ferric reductase